MAERREAVYIISVAAELAGVHPQTLRIYERRGLINPYRTPGGTRRYSPEDLERLGLIQELTDAGVNFVANTYQLLTLASLMGVTKCDVKFTIPGGGAITFASATGVAEYHGL